MPEFLDTSRHTRIDAIAYNRAVVERNFLVVATVAYINGDLDDLYDLDLAVLVVTEGRIA